MHRRCELPTAYGPGAAQQIRFGIVLLPNFTLTAFSGFVDLLRLASDDRDFSKPVRCAWSIVAETLTPVRASCGIQVVPWTTYEEVGEFDYVVVVGGLLHSGPPASGATLQFIRRAADAAATIVGICTGVFALARAGIIGGLPYLLELVSLLGLCRATPDDRGKQPHCGPPVRDRPPTYYLLGRTGID